MAIKIGEMNNLIVERKTDIGYILVDQENEEVFLHQNETNEQELNAGDNITAFIYLDSKRRPAATLVKPKIVKDEYGLLKVVEVVPNLGVFLDLGISKDLLLSSKILPHNYNLWPKVNDYVFVQLTYGTQMLAKLIEIDEYPNPKSEGLVKQEKDGYVVKLVATGAFVILADTKELVFVKKDEMREQVRLGQLLNLNITYETRLGYQASLIKQKEVMIDVDRETILSYLKRNDGVMPFTASTDSETIMRAFKLSRKAFKRALGALYRDRLVYFENEQTYLTDNEDDNNE